MSFITSYLPSIVSALIAILTIFNGDIQGLIASHPAIATSLGALYAILSHLLPSPAAK